MSCTGGTEVRQLHTSDFLGENRERPAVARIEPFSSIFRLEISKFYEARVLRDVSGEPLMGSDDTY